MYKRNDLLIPALILASGLFAGCGDMEAGNASESGAERAAPSASQDFEGTLEQIQIDLGADAIRSLAGSGDPDAILDLSPDRVIEAVHGGEAEAELIQVSRFEIKGRMARMETEGESGYTIIDGREGVGHVVDPQERVIMTMDPDELADITAGRDDGAGDAPSSVERIGDSSVRGFDATGYRVTTEDQIAVFWLSEEFGGSFGFLSDYFLELGEQLTKLGMGAALDLPDEVTEAGGMVRAVSVGRAALEGGGAPGMAGRLPAYSITESYGIEESTMDDDRFELPGDYDRQSFTEMLSGGMQEMMEQSGPPEQP